MYVYLYTRLIFEGRVTNRQLRQVWQNIFLAAATAPEHGNHPGEKHVPEYTLQFSVKIPVWDQYNNLFHFVTIHYKNLLMMALVI